MVQECYRHAKVIGVWGTGEAALVEAGCSAGDLGIVADLGMAAMDMGALLDDEDIKEFYLGLGAEGGEKSFRDVKHYRRRKRWLS